MTGLIRPLFWYCFSHRAKLHNKDRSPDITVDGVVWGGSVECACPSGFSQSDECQPSRDILEIISILRYLWKIPAPYSEADNECHTVLSDVDGGRIRFTQATYTTHTHKFIYTTAAAISTSQQHFEGCGTFTHTDTHRDTACPHDCLSKRISLSDGWGGNKLAEKRDNLLSFTLPNDFLKSVSLPWQLTLHFFLFHYLFIYFCFVWIQLKYF